jgi:uncharacterized protein
MTAVGIAGAIALGVAVGVVSGLIGLGGGVILIPALIFLYGMSQKMAQGTSVATLLLPIGIFAFWEYRKAGQVNLPVALWIAVGFTVGGYLGGHWAQHVSELALRRVFAAVLVAIAAKLAFMR